MVSVAKPTSETISHIDRVAASFRSTSQNRSIYRVDGTRKRILIFDISLESASGDALEKALAIALTINAGMLLGSPAQTAKFLRVRPLEGEWTDTEALGALSYLSSLCDGGFAALDNSVYWLKLLGIADWESHFPATLERFHDFISATSGGANFDSDLAKAEFNLGVDTGREGVSFGDFKLEEASMLQCRIQTSTPESVEIGFDQVAVFHDIRVSLQLNQNALLLTGHFNNETLSADISNILKSTSNMNFF